ncbi:MAG: hypothetical protein ACR2MS_07790 [Weeksellaceae bacterium]
MFGKLLKAATKTVTYAVTKPVAMATNPDRWEDLVEAPLDIVDTVVETAEEVFNEEDDYERG